jgi:outer membrane protein assembly factor BamA
MAKIKKEVLLILLMLTVTIVVYAQQGYTINYIIVDSADQKQKTDLQSNFASPQTALEYVNKLPALLQTKGYMAASLDSVYQDSLSATVYLYLGNQYKWAKLITNEFDKDLLKDLRWNSTELSNNPMQFAELQLAQEEILNYLEEAGHPFATIYLDSIELNGGEVQATLKIIRGPVYRIDSIRVYGDAKISNGFLQRYLDIPNGSIYSKKKLQGISKKLSELLYVEEEKPSDLTLLGTGSVLNLYLKQVKNSQVNALIGFLPNADVNAAKKIQITGEANVLLRNALGSGETMVVKFKK